MGADPLGADLAAIRARHHGPVAVYGGAPACGGCRQDWPCDAARLLARLDAAEALAAARMEAVQAAAVALAIVECLDRDRWWRRS